MSKFNLTEALQQDLIDLRSVINYRDYGLNKKQAKNHAKAINSNLEEHIEELKKQLENKPQKLPVLKLDKYKILMSKPEDLEIDMFRIENIPAKRKKYNYELF